MMELPEMHTFAAQIDSTIQGKAIAGAQANHSPHGFAWYTGNPASYAQILPGLRVRRARVQHATLRLDLGEWEMLLGAPPRYHEADKKLPDKHQLLLRFEDGSALTCTVQMWGSLFLYPAGEQQKGVPESYDISAAAAPFDCEFTQDYFIGLMNACQGKCSVKAFMATEQRIPGLGNGCLQDILWTARLHPKRKIAQLSGEEAAGLYRATVGIMGAMREGGGRDTERDLYGRWGGYRTICSSKRKGEPCPACDGPIVREAYLGGNIDTCPVCQRL